MPIFFSPTGQACTANEALLRGKLKPGYHEVLEDGERVSFDLAFRDSKSDRAAVFLTDAAGSIDKAWRAFLNTEIPNPEDREPHKVRAAWEKFFAVHFNAVGSQGLTTKDSSMQDAAINTEVARERMIHDQKFGFLPPERRPVFDEERARIIARSKILVDNGKAVRDAASAVHYGGVPTPADNARLYDEMVRDLTDTRNRTVRDLAYRSQY